MYATVAHTVLALTTLDFMFHDPDERDMLELLASNTFFAAAEKDMRKPLRVYAGEIMGLGAAAASSHVRMQLEVDWNEKMRIYDEEKAKFIGEEMNRFSIVRPGATEEEKATAQKQAETRFASPPPRPQGYPKRSLIVDDNNKIALVMPGSSYAPLIRTLQGMRIFSHRTHTFFSSP